MLNGGGEDFLCLAETVSGIQLPIDFHAVTRPLFDFVEVAHVRIKRTVGFLARPIVGHGNKKPQPEDLNFWLRLKLIFQLLA